MKVISTRVREALGVADTPAAKTPDASKPLEVGRGPLDTLVARCLQARRLNKDATAHNSAMSANGLRMALARFDITPEPKRLIAAVAEQLHAFGVAHEVKDGAVIITPDASTPLGAYAMLAAEQTGTTVSFSPARRQENPQASASYKGIDRNIQISVDALLQTRPGVNERHELIHAFVDRLGGAYPFSGRVGAPTGAPNGYTDGYDRSELLTYGDEIAQAKPKLQETADRLRAAARVTPGMREEIRAILDSAPTGRAHAFSEHIIGTSTHAAAAIEALNRSHASVLQRSNGFTLFYGERCIGFDIEGDRVEASCHELFDKTRIYARMTDPNVLERVRSIAKSGSVDDAKALAGIYVGGDLQEMARTASDVSAKLLPIDTRCAALERSLKDENDPQKLASTLDAIAESITELQIALFAPLHGQLEPLSNYLGYFSSRARSSP